MEDEKLVLYNLHEDLKGMFTSNNKLSDEMGSIKKIGLNSDTLLSGALSNTKGMLMNNTIPDVETPMNNMQPTMPENVPTNNDVPAYGVPVEPTVAVTPNMFENPLDGVYNEAKSFMDSEENSAGFTSDATEPALNDTTVINNDVPVTPGIEEQVTSPIPPIEMPVQPTEPSAENIIPQIPSVNDAIPPVNMSNVEPMVMENEQAVSSGINNAVEDVMPIAETPLSINTPVEDLTKNEIQETIPPMDKMTDVIPNMGPLNEPKNEESDIEKEINEVIKAIDAAKEKLMSLKEKMSNKEKLETKFEEPASTLNSEASNMPQIPTDLDALNVQKTPVVPGMPSNPPAAQDNMIDINSFFGKAA